MNARRRHLRAAACLTLVGLLACLPLAAAFGSVNEDDMVLRLSAAERALPPDRLPDFDASCAALMDEDGTLWFGRNADDAAQIASLTKIMTAIVAADWLDASTMIEVTPEAASVGESSAGLAQGDSLTFDDALKALLAASGHDAASAMNRGDGHKYYAVVLGSSSKPQRFVDSAALYDWAYANRSSLRAPIADEDIAGLAWGERVAFTVAWFMEGW